MRRTHSLERRARFSLHTVDDDRLAWVASRALSLGTLGFVLVALAAACNQAGIAAGPDVMGQSDAADAPVLDQGRGEAASTSHADSAPDIRDDASDSSTTSDAITDVQRMASDASEAAVGSDAAADSAPNHTVGSCSDLPASGAWQSIGPSGVNCTDAIALDPFEDGTIWVAADSQCGTPGGLGGIYKSTDCGSTWSHVDVGNNGAALDGSRIWSLAMDYAVPGVMYSIAAYGALGLWKSTNGGVDWQQLMPPGGEVATVISNGGNPPLAWIAAISMDPTNHLHLVAMAHANCTGQWAPTCLAETTDGGDTWSFISTGQFLPSWGEQTGPYLINATTMVFADQFSGLWLTTDDGVSWTNVAPSGQEGAAGGEYTHRPIWQANGTYYLPAFNQDGQGGPGGLLTSSDGLSWSSVANSIPSTNAVGFAVGNGNLYLSSYVGNTYGTASAADPTHWTALPSPAASEGSSFLEYDAAHSILYTSNWGGGLWRMVTP